METKSSCKNNFQVDHNFDENFKKEVQEQFQIAAGLSIKKNIWKK